MPTLTERTINFLTAGLNMKEVKSSSRKYRTFRSSTSKRNYYVGKAGAVRAGKTVSDSFSITEQVHANMKLWERRVK